ncbi:DUF5060 domain-containing protein [Gimesia chilikensis]|uniref:DUF5060 domain-containing protein n=1 Tax=Gimesia chilikensis TaxID=2605989 RepID=UPI00119D3546|nr:DUF5060 domain-containing protein [Gimesia chilikensis]
MITGISLSDSVVPPYEMLEISFQLPKTYDNPFDDRDVEAWAVFTGPVPTHTETIVLGFYDQQFEIVENDDVQQLEKKGEHKWKVRFAPTEIGKYHCELKVRFQQQPPISSWTVEFECKPKSNCKAENSKGFIRRNGNQFLSYDDGSTYFPIGYNMAWDEPDNKKVVDWFIKRLQKASSAKTNWSRIWMEVWGYYGLAIEWTPQEYFPGHTGVGRYSLESAWKLDRIMKLLQCRGIAAQLVIETHVHWQRNNLWPENPYNMCADGGLLGEPGEFFTDVEAKRLFKQRLRYIVARWSYSTSILAWEFFNEVENIDGFKENSSHVIEWHREMADYMREIDPAKHLITTSSHVPELKSIWSIPAIDLIQPHIYSSSLLDSIEETRKGLKECKKPIIIGEFGTFVCGVEYPEDHLSQVPDLPRGQLVNGLHLHNGIWSAAFQGTPAMLWWWNYIDQQQLYDEFAPLSTFWEGEILDDELQPAKVVLTKVPTRTRLWIAPGLLEFDDQPKQTIFQVAADGSIPGRENLHPVLHGEGHAELKTDPTFLVELEEGRVSHSLGRSC